MLYSELLQHRGQTFGPTLELNRVHGHPGQPDSRLDSGLGLVAFVFGLWT